MRPSIDAIASLALVVGAIAFLIFLGVEGTLIYSAWRFRASKRPDIVPQIADNRRLEIAWTALPLVILAVVFVLMIGTMREIGISVAGGSTPAAMTITATGHQFWWEYRYPSPNGDIVVANELHIPVNTAIDLNLIGGDVIHSFWVPALGGKTDMVPGKLNHLRLYADHTGTFTGQCAEFCGVEHAWMRIMVVAEPQADFQRWLGAQAQPRSAPTGPAARGEQVVVSNVCASCHTIRGTDAKGASGPDLTHVGSRTTLGAGVLENSPDTMRAWIADPQHYKPGSFMPQIPLSKNDLDAVVAYLEGLK